jgi:hypothetical protein
LSGGGSGLSGGGSGLGGGGCDVLTNITGTTTSATRLIKPVCNAHKAARWNTTTPMTIAKVLAFMSTELRRPFFLERTQAFAHIGSSKAHEFQRQRGIKRRPGLTQPVVEGIFGPTDGGLAAKGQFVCDFIGLVQQLIVFHTQ